MPNNLFNCKNVIPYIAQETAGDTFPAGTGNGQLTQQEITLIIEPLAGHYIRAEDITVGLSEPDFQMGGWQGDYPDGYFGDPAQTAQYLALYNSNSTPPLVDMIVIRDSEGLINYTNAPNNKVEVTVYIIQGMIMPPANVGIVIDLNGTAHPIPPPPINLRHSLCDLHSGALDNRMFSYPATKSLLAAGSVRGTIGEDSYGIYEDMDLVTGEYITKNHLRCIRWNNSDKTSLFYSEDPYLEETGYCYSFPPNSTRFESKTGWPMYHELWGTTYENRIFKSDPLFISAYNNSYATNSVGSGNYLAEPLFTSTPDIYTNSGEVYTQASSGNPFAVSYFETGWGGGYGGIQDISNFFEVLTPYTNNQNLNNIIAPPVESCPLDGTGLFPPNPGYMYLPVDTVNYDFQQAQSTGYSVASPLQMNNFSQYYSQFSFNAMSSFFSNSSGSSNFNPTFSPLNSVDPVNNIANPLGSQLPYPWTGAGYLSDLDNSDITQSVQKFKLENDWAAFGFGYNLSTNNLPGGPYDEDVSSTSIIGGSIGSIFRRSMNTPLLESKVSNRQFVINAHGDHINQVPNDIYFSTARRADNTTQVELGTGMVGIGAAATYDNRVISCKVVVGQNNYNWSESQAGLQSEYILEKCFRYTISPIQGRVIAAKDFSRVKVPRGNSQPEWQWHYGYDLEDENGDPTLKPSWWAWSFLQGFRIGSGVDGGFDKWFSGNPALEDVPNPYPKLRANSPLIYNNDGYIPLPLENTLNITAENIPTAEEGPDGVISAGGTFVFSDLDIQEANLNLDNPISVKPHPAYFRPSAFGYASPKVSNPWGVAYMHVDLNDNLIQSTSAASSNETILPNGNSTWSGGSMSGGNISEGFGYIYEGPQELLDQIQTTYIESAGFWMQNQNLIPGNAFPGIFIDNFEPIESNGLGDGFGGYTGSSLNHHLTAWTMQTQNIFWNYILFEYEEGKNLLIDPSVFPFTAFNDPYDGNYTWNGSLYGPYDCVPKNRAPSTWLGNWFADSNYTGCFNDNIESNIVFTLVDTTTPYAPDNEVQCMICYPNMAITSANYNSSNTATEWIVGSSRPIDFGVSEENDISFEWFLEVFNEELIECQDPSGYGCDGVLVD